MGNLINEPIVLDFFGLPGCGKSSVSHLLAEELRKLGKTVYEPSYETDHCSSPVRRKLSKFLCFIMYTINHPIKANRLIHLINSVGNNLFHSIVLAMIVIVRTEEINKHDRGIIILDQGLVQLAISICQKSLSTLNLAKSMEAVLLLVYPCKNIKRIHVAVSVDVALERAKQRGTTVSRVDREKNIDKKKAIMDYYVNASHEFLDYETVVINGMDSLQIEIDCLLRALSVVKDDEFQNSYSTC